MLTFLCADFPESAEPLRQAARASPQFLLLFITQQRTFSLNKRVCWKFLQFLRQRPIFSTVEHHKLFTFHQWNIQSTAHTRSTAKDQMNMAVKNERQKCQQWKNSLSNETFDRDEFLPCWHRPCPNSIYMQQTSDIAKVKKRAKFWFNEQQKSSHSIFTLHNTAHTSNHRHHHRDEIGNGCGWMRWWKSHLKSSKLGEICVERVWKQWVTARQLIFNLIPCDFPVDITLTLNTVRAHHYRVRLEYIEKSQESH